MIATALFHMDFAAMKHIRIGIVLF